MENKPLVIGITGAFGSGKSTAADFFESKGFKKIVLSSFLEEEARRQGVRDITRKTLQDIGNEWRKKYGTGVLADKALEFLKKAKIQQAVIDGIRNAGEIEFFRKQSRFTLLGIVANRETRFNRLKKIKRRELLTRDLFEKLDDRDLGIKEEKTGLQVAFCLALADVFIENNGSINEFKNKLYEFLRKQIEKL